METIDTATRNLIREQTIGMAPEKAAKRCQRMVKMPIALARAFVAQARSEAHKTHTHEFDYGGDSYLTDGRTYEVLQDLWPAAIASGDWSAVQSIVSLGTHTGKVFKNV